MAPKGNNMVPNGHFHKNWQKHIKTWFNQPSRKIRRANKRKLITQQRVRYALPIKGPLRPIVHCPTFRYHTRIRPGHGFTLAELRGAGLSPPMYARSIGISVDYRRRNKSIEGLRRNIQRLKEYKAKLILHPTKRSEKKEKKEIFASANMLQVFPIKRSSSRKVEKARCVTEEEKGFNAYQALRQARLEAKMRTRKLKQNLTKDEFDTKI